MIRACYGPAYEAMARQAALRAAESDPAAPEAPVRHPDRPEPSAGLCGPLVAADDCPVCHVVEDALGPIWACECEGAAV